MELWRLDAGVATWRDGSTSINGLPVVTISSGSDLLAITATDNAGSLGTIAERGSVLWMATLSPFHGTCGTTS